MPSLPRAGPDGSTRRASSKQVRPDTRSSGKAFAVQMALVPTVCFPFLLQKYLENYLNRLLTMSFYRNYHAMVKSKDWMPRSF